MKEQIAEVRQKLANLQEIYGSIPRTQWEGHWFRKEMDLQQELDYLLWKQKKERKKARAK
jgi:hypothetical protein